MRQVDFKALEALASIKDVLDLLGWKSVVRHGGGERGPCPVHGSSSPASTIFAHGPRGWFCHKCKQGGGAFRLWYLVKRLDPGPEAAVALCKALGHPVPYLPRRRRRVN
jgi:hypothetical protein